MSGHRIWIKFVSACLRLFVYLVIFGAVGICSYQLTVTHYSETKEYVSEGKQNTNQIIAEATVDQVAVNAIFAVNQETAIIEHIVLEVFNSTTKNLDFITVPVSIQYTMGQELYARLGQVSNDVPQIITLSEIGLYFDQAEAYEYGVLILEELLDRHISFYTAMITEDYEQFFVEASESEGTISKVKENVLQEMNALTTDQEFLEVLTDYYKRIQSNLTLEKRSSYITYYLNTNYDYVHYHIVEGMDRESNQIDTTAAANGLQQIVENSATYREAQTDRLFEEEELEVTPAEYTIQIQNASMVQGLAARYQERLEEAGYHISEIGNYNGNLAEVTRILVPEESIGNELAAYFKNAVIECQETLGDSEVVIILGRQDA